MYITYILIYIHMYVLVLMIIVTIVVFPGDSYRGPSAEDAGRGGRPLASPPGITHRIRAHHIKHMRSVLGWLETRWAQDASTYAKLA